MSTAPLHPFLGGDLHPEGSAPLGLELIASGKVRDVYALDDEHLLFVTTDRVSAFDVVMTEGVPDKGSVLTSITRWWFERTTALIPNHFVSAEISDLAQFGVNLDTAWKEELAGRILIVRRLQPTTVEWVIRGYLAGSGWKDYAKSGSSLFGQPLSEGLRLADRLPQPLFTPTTKDEAKDRPITPDEARGRVGAETYEVAHRAALDLFQFGTETLAEHGFLLADTKFEFGTDEAGKVYLIDEALTPDSSRFWPRETWQPGSEPPAWDKQVLRSWLEKQDWNFQAPPPTLSLEILKKVRARYFEICERITGAPPAHA
ncbi:MAG: phosphoribosylaminoimidazolesuccinocarboxamide synthase [Planctomycetota bacterium]